VAQSGKRVPVDYPVKWKEPFDPAKDRVAVPVWKKPSGVDSLVKEESEK
jgi:hypothetical protein